MNETKIKGLVNELQCQTYFTALGYNVSIPLGEDCRYDYIIDVDGFLVKVQAKTSRLHNDNGIVFSVKSSYKTSNGTVSKTYSEEEIDFFSTFYDNECYLVPVSQVGKTEKKLLFDSSNKVRNYSYLSDYQAEKILEYIKEGKDMPNDNIPKIEQYDLENNFIQSFSSPILAAKSIGKNQSSHIIDCAKGRRKTAYGYVWKYVKEEK